MASTSTSNTATRIVSVLLCAVMLAGAVGFQVNKGIANSVFTKVTQGVDTVSGGATVGDIVNDPFDMLSYSYNDRYYVGVVQHENDYTRIVADMTDDVYEELASRANGETGPDPTRGLVVTSITNYPNAVMTQDELDAFVDMTGDDLNNAGFTLVEVVSSDDVTVCTMRYGLADYTVTFDGAVEEVDWDDWDDASLAIGPLVSMGIAYYGISSTAFDWESLAY